MDTNPHENSRRQARRETDYAFLKRHYISSTPLEQIFGLPGTESQEGGTPVASPSAIMNPVHGDFYYPPEGSPVYTVPNNRGQRVVIGAHTPDADTPLLVPGERVISHPESKAYVKFNYDGSVNVSCDPGEDLYLNEGQGGSMVRPVTDVDFNYETVNRAANVWVPQ